MVFTRRLREGILRGEITCTVRIWQRPRVSVGGRYAFPPGRIVVDTIRQISFEDITPELAQRSGFLGVIDLLRTARHGAGENVYLVIFHYEGPEPPVAPPTDQ